MKCTRCGYESATLFSRCPSCGAVQNVMQNAAPAQSPYMVTEKKRSGGETAAIVIALIVSFLSLIAACVIFITYMASVTSKAISSDEFNFDSLEDFTSDDIKDKFGEFFNDSDTENGEFTLKSPAGLNTPIKFKEKLYSFSAGEVETEYEVAMIGTYRGEAALKMLDGAALPTYNDDAYDIYLVEFSVKITEQEKDAIVTLPICYPAAYPSDTVNPFSDSYSVISKLDYTNKYALIGNGDTVNTWVAFIMDKDEKNPRIMWNNEKNKAFCNPDEAVSDPSSVLAGIAIEKKDDATSEASGDESSSDDAVSSN